MGVEGEMNEKMRKKKKNVVVGVRIDGRSRELINWALVKVAEPGDCVVAVRVCRNADDASTDKFLLESYLEVYGGLCSVKRVELIGQILIGKSARRVLTAEAKNYDASALVVGISKRRAFRGLTSTARYCSKRLEPTTDVLAIHNGKVVFRRCNNNQLPGIERDRKLSLSLMENQSLIESQSEFGDSEAETVKSCYGAIENLRYEIRDCDSDWTDRSSSLVRKSSFRSTSPFADDILEHRPGWPLQRRVSSVSPQASHARKLSVVQWVMNLPNRSPQTSPRCSTIEGSPFERHLCDIAEESIMSSSPDDLRGFGTQVKMSSLSVKRFSYDVLRTATCHFSPDNLIAEGGCNRVYKGTLPDGKSVVIKIVQPCKEAWKHFTLEIDIMASLEHKNIIPLLGICTEDNNMISVYHYLQKGSLEENLHGKSCEKHVLSWEVRFNVAVAIAEALSYLHKECSKPVIHRDIKSSNILLSDKFEPQLSDFGLAIWGPTHSSSIIDSDVVGTFGYLAPEYFMYGKVSDKIDVYAFGVVLLELLSGKKPIGVESVKGQESLVMWAKPIIENGNIKTLLDPNLDGKFDNAQVQRMSVAATLCLTRAARLRPNIREVLKLLKGEKDLVNSANTQMNENEDSNDQDAQDDEVYPHSSTELHIGLALLDMDDDSTSFSSSELSRSLSIDEYLKARWSRSSSFD